MNFVLTRLDPYSRLPLTGWLKQQELTSYCSGSQEVQDQDAGIQFPVKVFFLACRWLSYRQLAFSHGQGGELWCHFPSSKDTRPVGLGFCSYDRI